jgi:polyhydroxyalkanoate synthesis regulator phasin
MALKQAVESGKTTIRNEEERIRKLVSELIRKGELTKTGGARILVELKEKAVHPFENLPAISEKTIQPYLKKFQIVRLPTLEETRTKLEAQIKALGDRFSIPVVKPADLEETRKKLEDQIKALDERLTSVEKRLN